MGVGFSVNERAPIAEGFGRLAADLPAATDCFYRHLFRIEPDTRALFVVDLGRQDAKLAQTLGVVAQLDRWGLLREQVVDPAIRHLAYGVRREHHRAVEAALLAMIRERRPGAHRRGRLAAPRWHPERDHDRSRLSHDLGRGRSRRPPPEVMEAGPRVIAGTSSTGTARPLSQCLKHRPVDPRTETHRARRRPGADCLIDVPRDAPDDSPMGRPTVIDIAREAGVSLATVDRVLNARPGVSLSKVAAVQDAVARLGWVRDVAAANLARGRDTRVVAVLSDGGGQFVETLAQAFEAAARLAATARMQVEVLRVPPEDPHALTATLAGLRGDVSGVALLAAETPLARDAIRALRARGIPVVTVASDLPGTERARFVGIDGHAAGRTAGVLMGRFLGASPSGQPAQVAVLAPSMLLRDSVERRRGFDAALLEGFPQVEALQTLETHGSAETLALVLRELRAHAPRLRGLYLLGGGHRALDAALDDLCLPERPVVIGHELTPHARAALLAGRLDAVVAQNPGHLARSALRLIRAQADGLPVDEEQERLRIEIVLRENLPPEEGAEAVRA